jgi:hypothetical protein
LNTLCGWTQPLKNWTITKNKQDTIITYNFTKQEFTNLRVYITNLEHDHELYTVDKIELIKKDSIIKVQQTQITNKDSIIEFKDTIINYQTIDFNKLNKWAKQEELLKIKYQKQASTIPYCLGCGSILGFILCLLLVK